MNRSRLALAIFLSLPFAASHAEPADRGSLMTKLDRLLVVGSAAEAAETAGSAQFIDQSQLDRFAYTDVQRLLRQVPGVYAIDEEGLGLRPNIGIRGSGTDRSSRITLMEDGVLIAPAPYAAPAAYYFPTMARMSALEVRKGSSAIKTGPRTTGGALNLVSTPIPNQLSGLVDLAYGSDQTALGHAWVGGRGERTGFLLETVQQNTDGFKRLDSAGPAGDDTGYNLQDYMGKFLLTSDANAEHYQELQVKLGHTEQDSNETYLGLIDADFRSDPNRRYAGSQLDNITTNHDQYELRHRIELNPTLDLTTIAYRNEFDRNWFKLEQVGGVA
ncbi:MAG: TonB-dependent receptor family protein, partial [Lysobacterales bacterium]